VQALPAILGLAAAIAIVTPGLQWMRALALTAPNYEGRRLAFPAGLLIVGAAAIALVPVAAIDRLGSSDVLRPEFGAVAIYVLGVAFLGLVDDLATIAAGGLREPAEGSASGPRGWRGHGATVLEGGFSSGALKAVGSLGLALLALEGVGLSDGRYLLAVAVLVLATNLFNLLDLRPGRAVKTFALLGILLTIGGWTWHPAAALGLFAAPVLVVGLRDLGGEAMLGDTGSNLVGALAGLWLVFALGAAAQAIALLVLIAITLYAEFRSISALIERSPLLTRLDSIGRRDAHSA
jgi:hypothetical protein